MVDLLSDLDALEQLAKMVVAPQPWRTDADVGHESLLDARGHMVADCAIFGRSRHITPERNRANAAFIAAASPDAVLGLIALARIALARRAAP